MHTHAKKKNINPKRCTIEKYKFKTKFAQNIGNKTIYIKSDDINDIMKIFWEFIQRLVKEKIYFLIRASKISIFDCTRWLRALTHRDMWCKIL